ncbi:metal-sensing transcriptional repressor [Breznakiella homolactica]|uniref:Copper-sensing transcriptional repressor CsoR n=1 Tax=Breznakiella homolactica TaxID=2798577 RepID=A0A7T7XM67_9SPIR|nr:metal-sensing transcriptional repressor [Breznakiella homolactica]QQO08861.1 metal-sensing transcriptional repressor [Breznakiella homolactica]
MRANKEKVTKLLRTARGQIDGIIRMVEADQYCIDIVNQLLASDAILKKAMKEVMHGHITGCVSDAFSAGKEEQEEKINEIIGVFDKLSR